MGTRGFVGFQSDAKETITYNQYDMYPSGVGIAVLDFVRTIASDPHKEAAYKAKAAEVKQVSNEVPPTRDQVVELIEHSNLNVSTRDPEQDWYVLLRETHGNPGAILDAGYAEHMPEWPLDSLFCEWGYLVDFDSRTLEVYEGFQTSAPTEGRWAGQRLDREFSGSGNSYYAVKKVGEIPFDDLPNNDEFVAKFERDDDE